MNSRPRYCKSSGCEGFTRDQSLGSFHSVLADSLNRKPTVTGSSIPRPVPSTDYSVILEALAVFKELPTRPSVFNRLWAILLVLTFSLAWALPLVAQIEKQSERMACCRKGKAHSCCKRSHSKTSGPSFALTQGCGSRCSVPILASLRTPLAEGHPGPLYVWALSPETSTLPVSAFVQPVSSRFHHLHPRPPPV
jgi:hypothetical protein